MIEINVMCYLNSGTFSKHGCFRQEQIQKGHLMWTKYCSYFGYCIWMIYFILTYLCLWKCISWRQHIIGSYCRSSSIVPISFSYLECLCYMKLIDKVEFISTVLLFIFYMSYVFNVFLITAFFWFAWIFSGILF